MGLIRKWPSGKRWIAATAGGLVILGPWVTGAFSFKTASATILVLLLTFSLCVLAIADNSSRKAKCVIGILSVCFSVTLFDVASRPFIANLVFNGAHVKFEQRWPPMPLVHRYAPNVVYQGQLMGNEGALTEKKEYREYHDETFVTDRFGFRNDIPETDILTRQYDLIILGDSYGVGLNTTQEQTWSRLLEREHGFRIYNLSIGGIGPWEEYINLALEIHRLRIKPQQTVLLWAIFTGKDLRTPCYPTLELTQLPWNGRLGALKVSFDSFRLRSPVRQLIGIAQLKLLRSRIFHGSAQEPVAPHDFLDGGKILFGVAAGELRNRSLEDVVHSPNYACVRATVAAMRKLADSEGFRVAIVLVPTKEEVYSWILDHGSPWSTSSAPSGFSIAFSEISREEGMSFLDLKPSLVAASRRAYEDSGELVYWRDDTHWNPRGNQEVAATIYEHLLRSLTAPAAAK